MPHGRSHALMSPAFLLSLAALVVNDFLLKRLAPGVITGKLSDFAGLFALTFMLCAFFGSRRIPIGAAIALAFIAWKSPASNELVAGFSAFSGIPIGRVTDPTDLVALVAIPAAAYAATRPAPRPASPRAVRALVASVAFFAFAATSVKSPPDDLGTPVTLIRGYEFDGTGEEFLAAAARAGMRTATAVVPTSTSIPPAYEVVFDVPGCKGGFTAVVELVTQTGGHVSVWLHELRSNCGTGTPMRSPRVFDQYAAPALGLRLMGGR